MTRLKLKFMKLVVNFILRKTDFDTKIADDAKDLYYEIEDKLEEVKQ